MLTNTERQQIVEEVNAGTYGIDEALDDIAAAQKGEEVRKALYAEALVLNREGHAGSTDMIARQQVANLQTSVNGQISTLRTEVGEDIADLETAFNSGLATQNGKIAAQNATIANVVANYNVEYGSTELWASTGETGALAAGTTVTLSEDVSHFDYIDIYSFCGNSNVLDTVPVDAKLQSSQGYALRWVNLSDPGSGSYKAYVRIIETRIHIIGTTLTIDHQVTYRNGEEVNISGAEITQSNRSTYMGELGIMKIVGRKITANTEIEDVRIGADGTEYASAGQAVRAQVEIVGDKLTNIKADLNAVNAFTEFEWTLNKSIDAAGAEFASNYTAATGEILCNEGDIFICNCAAKDANNKWFTGFLVTYSLQNGVYTFVARTTFTKGVKITIPSGTNVARIVFGRQSSNGVTITNEDISTYSSYEIYRKSAPLSAFGFPFGVAYQVVPASDATGVLRVTSSLSGSNRTYTLSDDRSDKTWYCAFACHGIAYKTSNNPNYTTTYLVPLTPAVSSTINRYKIVCLCINVKSKTFLFKEARDLTIEDYVLQMFVDGNNVTPWYTPAFSNSGMPENAMKPLMGMSVQGIRSFDESNVFNLTATVDSSTVAYTISDAKSYKTWYINMLVNGVSRQVTNDKNDASRTVFSTLTLSGASRYHLIAFTIRRPDYKFALKDASDLDVNDFIIALFFNGQNVTPWSETLFVQPSKAFEHLTPKVEHLTRNLYKVFKKVGCIGDSWTAGYLDTGDHVYGKSVGYSWPDYMTTESCEWVNGGYSGAMTSTYLTDETDSNGGGHKAIDAAGQCQAYIIGLGINDSRPREGISVGTSSDIGDSTKNTYYSWFARIIDYAISKNSDAFIFCLTMYPPLNNGTTDFTSRFEPYNQAVRDIVNYYQTTGNNSNVRLIDLAKRDDLFAILGRGWDVNGSHHGCVGYAYIAECMKSALGDELVKHPDLYHNIREIPYTT